jgi:hypothetical protein
MRLLIPIFAVPARISRDWHHAAAARGAIGGALRLFLLLSLAFLGAAVAPAAEIDLTTPDARKLKADAEGQRAEAARQRTAALHKLIDTQIDNARQTLAKAKLAGNIASSASSSAAVKLFTEVKASFEKDGSYAVAGKVRADLEPTVADFRLAAQVIEDKFDTATKDQNRANAAKLGALLARQQTPIADADRLLDLWTAFLGSAPGKPLPAPDGATLPATNAPAAAAALPADSQVLQTQGETANWAPLLKIEAVVRDAIEVVSFPLTDIRAAKTFTGTGPMGTEWQVKAMPFQQFVPAAATPAMRLRSLPPGKPLEVVAWPSPRNNWTIELRTKATALPSKHVVLLEADGAACKPVPGLEPPSLGALNTTVPASPAGGRTGATVRVRFESTPEGAFVFWNGAPVGRDGKLLTTPFEIAMSVNPVDIVFRKPGYKDVLLPKHFPTPGKPISATLVADGGAPKPPSN